MAPIDPCQPLRTGRGLRTTQATLHAHGSFAVQAAKVAIQQAPECYRCSLAGLAH